MKLISHTNYYNKRYHHILGSLNKSYTLELLLQFRSKLKMRYIFLIRIYLLVK